MPTNIEVKARTHNPDLQRERLAIWSNSPPEISLQEDTYFHAPQGRLKLRVFPSGSAQLIYYDRPDQNGPKRSNYSIFETDNPDGLKNIVSAALGIRGVVRKERHLYRIGQTRVHLDYVSDLGHFVELEVSLPPDQSDVEGEIIARELMAKLDIREHDLIEGAYIDLLEEKCGM